MKNAAQSTERVAATKEAGAKYREGLVGGGVFTVTCYDKDGNLKWEDKAKNLVVNVGLQDMNTKYFKGVTYTAAWYLGIVDNAGFSAYAAADTLASHTGWTEFTGYTGDRKAVTFGTATTADPSVIDNNASQASFSITGTATVRGAFLASVDTGTSGVLFSEADFESPGNRSVVSGDTLNVKYEFSLGDA